MMIFKETIRSITVQFGDSVLDDPLRLLGLLDDFGGFKDMEPDRRRALREQIRSGGVRQLLEVPKRKVRKIPKVNKTVQNKQEPPPAPVPQVPESTLTPKDWESILKAMNATGRPSVKQRIKALFSRQRTQKQVNKSPVIKPSMVKKTKVKVVRAATPKPVKQPRARRERRKLTEEQKTNLIVLIWCLMFLACVVICVTGFWKLFAGTISYSGASWMIFSSIIIGGILWLFNEAF